MVSQTDSKIQFTKATVLTAAGLVAFSSPFYLNEGISHNDIKYNTDRISYHSTHVLDEFSSPQFYSTVSPQEKDPLDYIDEITWDVSLTPEDEMETESVNMNYDFLKDEDTSTWI